MQTHLSALPLAVQDVVNKLNQPLPDTEKALAQKLKTQVTELKTISMKKAQLQTKLHQARLNEGQTTKTQNFVRAVHAGRQQDSNIPAELGPQEDQELPIPMAVETFATSLGFTQLHGLLKRPGQDANEASKRRKTEPNAPWVT